MAQEIEVKIKVDTKEATKNVETFGKTLEVVSKNSQKATDANEKQGGALKELGSQLTSNSKLTQALSQATGGMSDAFVGAVRGVDLTKISLTTLKPAIMSTGIGVLVILVGELISALADFFSSSKRSERALDSMTKSAERQMEAFDSLGDFYQFAHDNSIRYAKANGENKDQIDKRNEAFYQSEKRRIEAEIALNERKRASILRNEDLTSEDRKKALSDNEASGKKLDADTTKNYRNREGEKADFYSSQKETEKQASEDALSKQKQASEKAQQQREQAGEKAKQQLAQEKSKLEALEKKYNDDIENLGDKTEEDKLATQKQRAIKELDEIKLSEEAKANARLLIEKDFQIKEEELKKAHNEKILGLNQKLEDDKKSLQAKSDEEKLVLAQTKASADLEKQLTEINATETEKETARRNLKANFDLQNDELKIAKAEKEKEEKIAMIELELEDENISFEAKKQLILDREALLLQDKNLSESEKLRIHKEAVEAEKTIDKENYESKMALLGATSDLLSKASDVIGKETGVGKGLAIASALMNTYQGITTGLKLPYPASIPAVAMASLTGFAAVKNIMAVKVPGGGGSGGNSIKTPPASAPSFNVVGNSGVNAIAETMAKTGSSNKPIEAFVVAQNVTSAQSLNRNIVSNATLG